MKVKKVSKQPKLTLRRYGHKLRIRSVDENKSKTFNNFNEVCPATSEVLVPPGVRRMEEVKPGVIRVACELEPRVINIKRSGHGLVKIALPYVVLICDIRQYEGNFYLENNNWAFFRNYPLKEGDTQLYWNCFPTNSSANNLCLKFPRKPFESINKILGALVNWVFGSSFNYDLEGCQHPGFENAVLIDDLQRIAKKHPESVCTVKWYCNKQSPCLEVMFDRGRTNRDLFFGPGTFFQIEKKIFSHGKCISSY